DPQFGEGSVFKGWDKELEAHATPDVYYYTAVYEERTPIITDVPLTACDSFVFEGITYRENWEWDDTLSAASGTDSIVAYHLTLHKSVMTDTTITAMQSITWQGVTYTESASWSDTLQTVYGCDSIIRINLVVKTVAPPPITVDKIVHACDSFVA
ncbi:hypothetical protein RCJ22_25530, partial [Vibrio sp. FNV 38]|nr:hypothetical protein [Vibrio sp. FNV 38]